MSVEQEREMQNYSIMAHCDAPPTETSRHGRPAASRLQLRGRAPARGVARASHGQRGKNGRPPRVKKASAKNNTKRAEEADQICA